MNTLNFSKKDTSVIKGVAIILLIVHHCFCSYDRFANYTVIFTPLSQSEMIKIAAFFKICVGMFVFLTSFGLTKSLKNKFPDLVMSLKDSVIFTINRILSLWNKWIIIFIICEIFGFLYAHSYNITYGFGKRSLLYFLIDSLGLANLFGTPTFVPTWWYMSLAFTIIILFSTFINLYKKYDILLILIIVILPRAFGLDQTNLIRWSMAIVLGIVFADKKIMENLKSYKLCHSIFVNKVLKLILSVMILIIFFIIRQSDCSYIFYDFNDGVIPVFVIYFCYEFLCDIPIIKNILSFLGKHSMNIFLIHTLIRGIYFEEFIYSFKNAYIIIFVLLLISTLISLAIELILKLSNYNIFIKKLQNITINFIEKKLFRSENI